MIRRLALPLVVAVLATVGLASCKTMPDTGLYSSQQHTDAQLTTVTNQVYGTALNRDGTTATLRIDWYLPPAGGPTARPTVILVHGGGFVGGDKSSMAGTARTYARRGYVAASISYRVDPGADPDADPVRYLTAARNAIDDGMEAVRWVRSKAATYRVDPTRIAMVGTSAGGAIALGVGAADDPTPGGPLAAHSPKIQAAVATGAHLTPGIPAGLVTFEKADAPALMFHYDTDTVTGHTAAYAKQTCDGLKGVGATCTFVQQAGSGHTTSVSAGGTWWTSQIGTFLWTHLKLFT